MNESLIIKQTELIFFADQNCAWIFREDRAGAGGIKFLKHVIQTFCKWEEFYVFLVIEQKFGSPFSFSNSFE